MIRRITATTGALLLLILGTRAGAAADSGSGFTTRLSAEDFAAAGLGKLTEAERETLDRLVAQSGMAQPSWTATRATASSPATEVQRAEPSDSASVPDKARVRRSSGSSAAPRTIHSRLDGTFTGWTGDTIFELENGQRWVQVGGDTYRAHPPRANPAVRVQPAMMGTYFLKVEGCGTRCRVKLLED